MIAMARILALILSLIPGHLWALSTDSSQPIAVEADTLEVRNDENISIYQGNVRLIQGSLEIKSERLVIHFNDAQELQLFLVSSITQSSD